MHPSIRIIGRGGERAANYRRYLSEMSGLDILVVFLGGNDITNRNGEHGVPLADVVRDIKNLSVWAKNRRMRILTCDIIPRESNFVGTDLTNKRLMKRMKKKHIKLEGFEFAHLRDGVHLRYYGDLWAFLERKLLCRLQNAYGIRC